MVIFFCLVLLVAVVCFAVGIILVNDDRKAALNQNKEIVSKNTIGSMFNMVLVKENNIRIIIDIFLIALLSVVSISSLLFIGFILWSLR